MHWFGSVLIARILVRLKALLLSQKKIRGLAWVACRWAAKTKPRVIILENVEEFKTWGPLDKNGQPIKSKSGWTFTHFINSLKKLGYSVDYKELKACDFGAPTIRKRFFLIARSDGLPIVWPSPTHGKGLAPYKTVAKILDWTIPVKSIFERKKPLSDATCKRIARGIKKFVIDNPSPFIVQIGQTGLSQDRSSFLKEPLRTIVNFDFKNSSSLIVPSLIQIGYGEKKGQAPRILDLKKPCTTIVSTCKQALVATFIDKYYSGEHNTQLTTPKKPTVDRNSLVYAFLDKYYGSEKDGQSAQEPIGTITTKQRFSLITINGNDYQIKDICMRMLTPRELYRAQGFPDDYIIDRTIDGLRITQTEQIAKCGNAVPPAFSEALVKANLPELAVTRKIETMQELHQNIDRLLFSNEVARNG